MKRGWTTASATAGNEQHRTCGDVSFLQRFLNFFEPTIFPHLCIWIACRIITGQRDRHKGRLRHTVP